MNTLMLLLLGPPLMTIDIESIRDFYISHYLLLQQKTTFSSRYNVRDCEICASREVVIVFNKGFSCCSIFVL